MSFSENFIALQNKRGLTNYRLAKELGVHATTIQNWRDGKSPQLTHINKVADYFGVTLDELIKEEIEHE